MESLPTPPEIEPHYTLGQAAAHFPSVEGRRVSTASLWRWARKGSGPARIRLRYVRVGRRVLIPRSAIGEFLAALASEDDPGSAPTPARPAGPRPPSPSVRAKQIADADARCKAAGL